jgi:hypothetical protein
MALSFTNLNLSFGRCSLQKIGRLDVSQKVTMAKQIAWAVTSGNKVYVSQLSWLFNIADTNHIFV